MIKNRINRLATAAAVGACLVTLPLSSEAAPRHHGHARWHGGHGHHWNHHAWRHHEWRHGWHGGGWRYGYGYYDDDAGAALAAGTIFGLAAGAIAAGAANNNAVAYCERRFRSYDPASGTYLGYDGYRHPCP